MVAGPLQKTFPVIVPTRLFETEAYLKIVGTPMEESIEDDMELVPIVKGTEVKHINIIDMINFHNSGNTLRFSKKEQIPEIYTILKLIIVRNKELTNDRLKLSDELLFAVHNFADHLFEVYYERLRRDAYKAIVPEGKSRYAHTEKYEDFSITKIVR